MSILDKDNEDVEYLGWEDEDDFVTVRAGGFRIVRALVALVILVAIGWFLYIGVRSWFSSQLDPDGEPGAAVTVNIPSGATTGDIAELLEANGVVPNSTFFRYFAEWTGEGNFQAGEYFLNENSSAEEAIATLNIGPIPPEFDRFGVPEGLWVSEMLPQIAEQLPSVTVGELQAVLNSGQLEPRYRPAGVTSWEGLLFPAFYQIEDDATPVEVLAKMNNEFARVTAALGYGAAETTHNLSAYEVIIIASMIEAEARTEEDRAKISRVIYNRLQQGWALGIDATCVYSTGQRGIELTVDVLDDFENPYACRKNTKLPPTPIAAPGKASLDAALNPADGDWLWYVLKDADGNHLFTDDAEEFEIQKQKSKDEGLF